jgi:hypothetical protein
VRVVVKNKLRRCEASFLPVQQPQSKDESAFVVALGFLFALFFLSLLFLSLIKMPEDLSSFLIVYEIDH